MARSGVHRSEVIELFALVLLCSGCECQDPPFAAEAFQKRFRGPGVNDFQGYPRRQLIVIAKTEIHGSHSAAAQHALHAIRPDAPGDASVPSEISDGLVQALVQFPGLAGVYEQRFHIARQN